LLTDGVYAYEYDGEGNRTRRTEILTGEVTEYEWDLRNRLTGVRMKDGAGLLLSEASYVYDVNNQRIAKVVDGAGAGVGVATTERFVYDGNQIALTFDGAGNQRERFLYGPTVDQVIAQEGPGGLVRWALADQLGSVRDVVDGNGAVVNHLVYDSFGNIESESNGAVDFRFGYTGREFDEESGQYYYRTRYYDAGVGRFLSEDPISFKGGDANLYRYVGNNSTNVIDPTGLLGRVIEQERHLVSETGVKTMDNGRSRETTYPLIVPFRTERQNSAEYNRQNPFSNLFDKSPVNPFFPGVGVTSDRALALIEYIPGTAGQITPKRTKKPPEPWGGLYRRTVNSDEIGHIVPHILGGSLEKFNLFSQTKSINRGGYNQFGLEVNTYLDKLGRVYDQLANQAKQNNSCLPEYIHPPQVLLDINLSHDRSSAPRFLDKPYPFTKNGARFHYRPFAVEVKATYENGHMINGWFSNNPSADSKIDGNWWIK
jgi:RHS repeat-associated protein